LAGIVLLFSGGHDSITLAHLMKDRASHAAHANTGIGIEKTRQFVRDTCKEWGLPLIEEHTLPQDQYRTWVKEYGFPGPSKHWKAYGHLKQNSLRRVRRQLVGSNAHKRVIFLAGRRRDESKIRAKIPMIDVEGSTIWVSPIVHWTKPDIQLYRSTHDVPVNEVADLIHKSGECLCGCFASEGEREELEYWFPDDLAMLKDIEAEIADDPKIPSFCKKWGWGADPEMIKAAYGTGNKAELIPSPSGNACGGCTAAFEAQQEHNHVGD
jgi:3'-phosphoadenosine 5'-phosphosulfate sulfotransferase (PAPS reductase)/FAD synthetase